MNYLQNLEENFETTYKNIELDETMGELDLDLQLEAMELEQFYGEIK